MTEHERQIEEVHAMIDEYAQIKRSSTDISTEDQENKDKRSLADLRTMLAAVIAGKGSSTQEFTIFGG